MRNYSILLRKTTNNCATPLQHRPNEIMLPDQRDWVFGQSRFKIGLWARQTGKSIDCAAEAVECALGRPRTEWVVLSAPVNAKPSNSCAKPASGPASRR